MTLFERLSAPFSPDVISWRVGSTNRRAWEADKSKPKRGQVLAYIDARDVMERLDDVVGPPFWQCDYTPMPNGTTCCRIEICIDGHWIGKANGAGATGDTSKESEREMAEKGGYSDAFKRAAVLWGVGRYLYTLDSPWIALDDYWGIPKTAIPGLMKLLPNPPATASQARKDGEYPRLEAGIRATMTLDELRFFWTAEKDAIAALPPGWRKSLTEEKDRHKNVLTAAEAA